VTDEYISGEFHWRYLNAPFYVVAIAAVLHGLSAFFLGEASLEYLAFMLTAGTLLGHASTLSFAVAESWAEEKAGTI
jgi:putative membrane protein